MSEIRKSWHSVFVFKKMPFLGNHVDEASVSVNKSLIRCIIEEKGDLIGLCVSRSDLLCCTENATFFLKLLCSAHVYVLYYD